MGHGAWGMGHGAWGIGYFFPASPSIENSGVGCIETCI